MVILADRYATPATGIKTIVDPYTFSYIVQTSNTISVLVAAQECM